MVLSVLIWLMAIGFWYTAYTSRLLLGMPPGLFFENAIVLAILVYSMKACTCCRKHWMGMKSQMMEGKGNMCEHGHGMGCSCDNCGNCK